MAWTFQNFPHAESLLARSLPDDNNRAQRLICQRDPAASEALHLAWRDGLINKQIDQLLAGTPVDKDGQFVAGTSGPEMSNLQQSHVVDQLLLRGSTAGLGQTTLEISSTTHQMAVLPDSAWTLLEFYFAFTHSWLPMTEKSSMLKLMYSYPPGGLHIEDMSTTEHAELWAIMALAASQVFDNQKRDEARRILEIAEHLLPVRNASYEVPHIKAMILLTLIDAQEGRILVAWLRIGTVVSLLLLFQLLEKLGATERWCRNIHLVAFVVESALASHLKAPGHLTVGYIEAIGFVDEDGLDEWAPWHDPLDTVHHDSLAKAPARSFSTLNKLVRASIHSSNSYSATNQTNRDSSGKDATTVFSLLQNATLKGDRVQPSALVDRWADQTGGERVADQTSHDSILIGDGVVAQKEIPRHDDIVGDGANLSAVTDNNFAIPGVNDLEGLQNHRFMSIPNEMNNFPFESSPDFSQSGQSELRTTDTSRQNPSQFEMPMAQQDNFAGDANIFEEFDAMLERQDMNHEPQFMQNLGFAPDLDLAEFFGPDYQPSNPLLAYVVPGTSNQIGPFTT